MKIWLQPPRLRIGEDSEEHRHATWLELFYDLVFVVAVSQVAHYLSNDVSLSCWRVRNGGYSTPTLEQVPSNRTLFLGAGTWTLSHI